MRLRIFNPEAEADADPFLRRRFDWLVVEARLPKIGGHIMWLCRCVCGRVRSVRQSDLLRHHTRSCGKCYLFPHSLLEANDECRKDAQ